jgi:hypothetical protein
MAGGDECSRGADEVWVAAALVFGYGELLVGPGFMKCVMSSGVLAGVTLSMNCQAGRRRTEVLWSEWSGTGMSEAESMSFYIK